MKNSRIFFETKCLEDRSCKALRVFLVFALTILSACGTDPKKKMTYHYQSQTAQWISEHQAYKFYEKQLIGEIVIWTDMDFLTSSKLNDRQLSNSRDIVIFGEGSARSPFITLTYGNKFVIYMPPGKIWMRSSVGTSQPNGIEFVLKGGETKHFYWKNPESKLLEGIQKPASLISQNIVVSYLNLNELTQRFFPKVEFSNEISKDENQINFNVTVSDINLIKNFRLNNAEVPFKKNEPFTISRQLNFGKNEFTFFVENEYGFEDSAKFEFTRLTSVEKKKIANDALAEKKRLAEAERQERIRLANEEKARKAEIERIAREGDGSDDDLLCKKYGLKPQTNGYAECRMRLDFAKRESTAAQEKYNREKAAYDSQMAAIQKEREQQRAMRQLELGLRMMGGQSPVDAVNSIGTNAPIAPRAPNPINQTITMPSGRMITCTTMGTMTNCN